jgi:hypothetical protein
VFAPARVIRPFLPAALAVIAALAASSRVPAAGQGPDPSPPPVAVTYTPPVDAPVVAGFDPPTHPYGPGNRGLEFGTGRGQPVRAAAAGRVTFAGSVAGERYVTVLHADRVRTTYGRVAAVAVAEGEVVRAGAVVATAADGFIWTARVGTAYLDPAVLLAASGHPILRLVPDAPASGRAAPAPVRSRPVPVAAAAWALEGTRPCPVCSPTGPAPAVPSPRPRTLLTPRSRPHVVPGQGVATDGKEGPWPPSSP